VCILENTPRPQKKIISPDVIWGEYEKRNEKERKMQKKK
jgi:hypothetical protein